MCINRGGMYTVCCKTFKPKNFKNWVIICQYQPDVTRCQNGKRATTDVSKGVHHDKSRQSVPSPIKALLVAYQQFRKFVKIKFY